MYKGFNLEIVFTQDEIDLFYQKGKDLYSESKTVVSENLKEMFLTNGNLDGTRMQENWFPQIESDIFISHSHSDEKTAITLAGFLNSHFGLKCFIDSCIWGYSNNLLRLIDDKYCKQPDGYYNYSKRNFSTSHVHMMLSTALNMMIDKSECLFFLNTPNSVTTKEVINKTESPWIYAEISMSKLIRKKHLSAYRRSGTQLFSKGGQVRLNESIEYELDLEHLTDISRNEVFDWYSAYAHKEEKYPLDILYRQTYTSNIIGG